MTQITWSGAATKCEGTTRKFGLLDSGIKKNCSLSVCVVPLAFSSRADNRFVLALANLHYLFPIGTEPRCSRHPVNEQENAAQ